MDLNNKEKDINFNEIEFNLKEVEKIIQLQNEREKYIDARHYLKEKDDITLKDRYEAVQIIAMGLIKRKPNITREELISTLNDIIQEHIKCVDDKNNNKEKTLKKSTNYS